MLNIDMRFMQEVQNMVEPDMEVYTLTRVHTTEQVDFVTAKHS